ncbi:MAG: undecaprenyl-diphosphate phosphatase [Actinobacteria bacterium]|nr:undecaprenyl-diphosphate phosphatase [Actinomycetota bacterium]
MDLIQAVILGIVQGLTEFLPISSSAHLILLPFYIGWTIDPAQNIPYYVIVHFGTLVAVLTFFRKDIKAITLGFIKSISERRIGDDPYRRLSWFIVIGTLPVGIVYLLIKELLENTLETPGMVAFFLLITGTLLVVSERLGARDLSAEKMRASDAVFIGFAQGLALLPGLSRSGSTIAAGLFRGLTRESAARFSFLLSIPVIIAGTIEEMTALTIGSSHQTSIILLVAGFVTATVSGYFAIKYFIDYLKKHSLYIFALYCFALGAITLIASSFK